MTKTAKAARKFQEDKNEMIKRLIAMVDAVRAASTPEDLDALVRARGDRATNLTAKLAGALCDYVHSR